MTFLNNFWQNRKPSIILSYINHPNPNNWYNHFIQCLATIATEPPKATVSYSEVPARNLPAAEIRLIPKEDFETANTELQGIWDNRVEAITNAYITYAGRDTWVFNFMIYLAKIREGPPQGTTADAESAPADIMPKTEQSSNANKKRRLETAQPRLQMPYVSYDRTMQFRIEAGCYIIHYQPAGASAVQTFHYRAPFEFRLNTGIKFYTCDFSKVSILVNTATGDGYRLVPKSDLKTDSCDGAAQPLASIAPVPA
ncbi:hypothetical protein QBC32DRAFT_387317 [Pseudoneurospora amorphoporcata]|uniref:Uncharacterized protein n=1 Tax=Pseudoneurospora amorphoporcata TaxID=241081 RepID=A0AAN6NJA1_9PEZI|nr:hypothetical protein QBC32DRAFT_387317 [Pseudoneurospora amorphoporcata]